jgi:hypothetical protein
MERHSFKISELRREERKLPLVFLASALQRAPHPTLKRTFASMNRLMSSLAAFLTASFAQGCATVNSTSSTAAPIVSATTHDGTVGSYSCGGPKCAAEVLRVAHRTEVPVEKDAPNLQGHPLTAVVVTQCNLIVAVYMTMSDGTLLRFDSSAKVSADQLLQMAYTATRSERVEVSCNDSGAVGYEKHEPT